MWKVLVFCFFSSSFFTPPFLLLNQKNGLTVCKTRNETCLTLPGGAVNPLQWAELSFICLGFGSEFLFFAILLLVDVRGEEEKKTCFLVDAVVLEERAAELDHSSVV